MRNETNQIRAIVRRVQVEADRMSPPLADGTRTNRLIHSGIETFYKRPPFMYMALRPAGGDAAARNEWPLTRHLFDAGNRHSAVLDESWHSSGRGLGAQQLAVQAVFSILAGDDVQRVLDWARDPSSPPEDRLSPGALGLLRQTPMCHMDPFRIDLVNAGRIAADGPAARAIGLQIAEAVRPRVLIADGNSEGDRWTSPWAYARWRAPHEQPLTLGPVPPNYSYKEMRIMSGPLRGVTVVGLPTLSRTRGSALAILIRFLAVRLHELRAAASGGPGTT